MKVVCYCTGCKNNSGDFECECRCSPLELDDEGRCRSNTKPKESK